MDGAALLVIETRSGNHSAHVSRESLDAFIEQRRAALAAARERIARIAQATVKTEVGDAFINVRERVPGFVAWTYGWASSYVFSYELIWAGARAGAVSAWKGEEAWPAVQKSVDDAVSDAFRRHVLEPARFEKGVIEGANAASEIATQEWRFFAQAEEEAWLRFARAGCQPGVGAAPQGAQLAFPMRQDAFTPPKTHAIEEAQFGAVFARRALRPLGTRAVVVGLRILELGSLAALPAAVGLIGATGAAGVAATIATAWTVDFVINATDSTFNRAGFEGAILERLSEAERRIEQGIDGALGAELTKRADAYAQSLAGMRS